MPKLSLSKSEKKVMNFLWEQDKVFSAFEVRNLLCSSFWGGYYTRVILYSLEKKGLIERCGFDQHVRRFRCALTKEAYDLGIARKDGADRKKLFWLGAEARAQKSKEKEQKEKEELDELIQKLEAIIEEYRREDEEEEKRLKKQS
ncbi:MAG: BlaI/MecI/CopY family transcriptional regulator [Acutalibacter sp.]|nr:BlaI/MecI/CopY family transcriptional regulator [Acutalibacter sp.]